MGDLRSFYDSIDLAAIRELVARRRSEDLHLEFKVLTNNRTFEREDRRNLAKAVSGLANSEGGVVVWGVVARRNDDDIDAAVNEQLIDNVDKAFSELQTYGASATSPVVDGVLHKRVHADGDGGFLVTFVPPSDRTPHMAKLGEDRYYKRSGDTFYRMEHFDIADMFGRRAKPELSLHVRVLHGPVTTSRFGKSYEVALVLGMLNTGRGIARFPSLALAPVPPFRLSRGGLDGNGRTGLPMVPSWGPTAMAVFAGGSDQVVHVDSVLEVTRANAEFHESGLPSTDASVRYRITADGIPPIEGEHIVPCTDLLDVTQT